MALKQKYKLSLTTPLSLENDKGHDLTGLIPNQSVEREMIKRNLKLGLKRDEGRWVRFNDD